MMSRLRALLCGSALLLLAAPPVAAQRTIAEGLGVPGDAHVTISNVAGWVKITGWARDSIAVTGTVSDTKTERFTVQRAGSAVRIGLWDAAAASVPPSHVEVRVPSRASVTVRTGSASVFIADVSGALDVASIGGEIEIRGAPRSVLVESMTGPLIVDVRTGSVRAKTVTSAIRLHGSYDDATATSVSGSILLDGAVVRRGSFEAVDGELRFVGALRPDAELAFVTHAGAVEFLLPAATSATFRSIAFGGSFQSEFSEPVRTAISKVKGTEHDLSVGGGEAQISVRSFRGRVVIRRR
jgi:hypothetical protein